jgi:fusaric acid resistance family protein
MKINQLLQNEINWSALLWAIFSLVPVALGYWFTQDVMFWNVGLVTISLGIGAERLNLGILAITLHFLLILICFTLLFFAFLKPYLFILVCAALGYATIYFTRYGGRIRTLGNYTFIPTVYLTCELHETITPALTLSTYLTFISLMPIALLSVVLVYVIQLPIKRRQLVKWVRTDKLLKRVFHGAALGEPERVWAPAAAAIFLGVMIAAALVIFLHISRGEWVIWSVASVVTLEFASSKQKFNERLIGALIGVPLGFLAAQYAPKTEFMYATAAIGIMLTLVAFKRYRLAFGSRCFLVAFAAFIASATPTIAVERIANVLLGGVIGVASVYLMEMIFNKFRAINN